MSQLCSWLRHLTYIIQALRLPLSVFLVLLCISFRTVSGTFVLDDVAVYEKDGVYHINIIAEIAATEEYVRQILTDYVHLYRLSDSIIESEVLMSSIDEKVQVRSLVLCCTPVFCREVTRVEEISVLESGDLQTVIIPGQSDFSSGKAVWKIAAKGDKTRLTYLASVEPDFFIPPILGTQMVINNMRNELKTTLNRIERIASINEAREWDEDFAYVNVGHSTDGEPCNDEFITSLQ